MAFVIAVNGKGGVGKTTVAGLIVSRLIQTGRRPVLAVDGDPNMCLDSVLGVEVVQTVGGLREDARAREDGRLSGGLSKTEQIGMAISRSLVEKDGFDLIAMGRPEGPGCYCYANNVIKDVLQKLSAQYPFVVLDNEAGLENLSRRIMQRVNLMVMVADPSKQGLDTLVRLHDLAAEMGLVYDHLALVINRLRSGQMPARVNRIRETTAADIVVALPEDTTLLEYAESGRSLLDLPANNPVLTGIDRLLDFVQV